ncbi:FAD:protein FMN transferase [Rhodoferax fermentans]|uniref:FAD:protein FMN transferase n=1 Tax=Rhodoferax fermentans TaxID=28066 RepID=A0A1T1ARE0_RHOFE|nr:FAD:protein FMN transferase [Rhodoferax fermentans]MBK1683249.1 FAD:protein FMN transferase [Rhodoferax fermentans]OOV06681.1 thiamine biosynthesis protein ApbE [Rhodoferax fermentans]
MRRRTLLSASLGLGSLAALACFDRPNSARSDLRPYSGSGKAFGTTVSIALWHDDATQAQAAITEALAQVSQVDALMSLHQEHSQVYQLNLLGRIEKPDPHLVKVLTYARQLSEQTAGAFDITVQPLWRVFTQAQARGELPRPEAIASAKALVNWQGLSAGGQQVSLAQPGMGITLNGLAQGYAADLVLASLHAHGISHALVDTGEFGALGHKTTGLPWVLGIKNPRHTDALAAKAALDGRQLATSGDYETFFSPDYIHHHIFDPATGDSPTTLASATVLAPTGLMADGLSTAFMVMGANKALALAQQLPQVDALLIHKNGAIQVTPKFPALSA